MPVSPIVQLLAERPEAELQEMLHNAREEMSRVYVEIEQIEEALQRQARRGSRSSKRGGKAGGTRKRILEVVSEADEPMSPSEIITALKESGGSPTNGAVHNMIRRLVEAKELTKVSDGQYRLASRDRSQRESGSGSQGNGANGGRHPYESPRTGLGT